MSDSLQPHGPQHARPPCQSPTPRACSNSYPLSQWCHPTISSSVIPFSSHLQSFPASRFISNESALRIRWPKYWSFSFNISPSRTDIQDWFPLGWNYKMHWKFYLPLFSVSKYHKSLLTCLPIFTTATSNSIFHGADRLIFPSSLSLFFLLFFSYIFTYLSFFLYLMHQKSHHFPAVNPFITSYGLKNNIPNLWQALESFDFIFSLTAHCTPATLVFFLWKCQSIVHLGALHQ